MSRSEHDKPAEPRRTKTWEPPVVKKVGTIAEVLKGGGGKLSITAADSGDVRKPKGQG